ncbi:MAG: hypothetical protein CVU05_13550 [Bacteroidetes bacterium HGW-Bacteroidetes-21]|jgi:hypothetical protein|nr:MAG: hypothetical protein CVU05_13550 [Bacteroidetes bacterium HGW-Bacteroidetes-21]
MICLSSFSQEEDGKPVISGSLSTDNRFLFADDNPWSWNENRIDLKIEHKFSTKARFGSDIWFRKFALYNDQDAYYKYPEIREAYMEVYDFLMPGLDLKAGRQRIKWGCADKINPVDNVNSYDLEDLWDFGRHMGNEAIKLKYYKNDWQFEAVYLPVFTEARLPLGNMTNALMPEFKLPTSYSTILPLSDTLIIPISLKLQFNELNMVNVMPKINLSEGSSGGFRVANRFGNFDVAMSYLYARDGLPVANQAYLSLDSVSLTSGQSYLRSDIELIYPRMHYVGAEVTGTIGSVGVWAEAVMVKPNKKYYLSTELPDFSSYLSNLVGIPITLPSLSYPDSLVLDNKPWFRYVVGCDYTFGNGIYMNFQFAHGFMHERTSDELNDYFLLRAEKKIMNEKLRLSLLSGGFAVSDWSNISSNNAFAWTPEIGYKPNDNTEIILGTRIIDGVGDGMFAKLKNQDELFLRLSYSF